MPNLSLPRTTFAGSTLAARRAGMADATSATTTRIVVAERHQERIARAARCRAPIPEAAPARWHRPRRSSGRATSPTAPDRARHGAAWTRRHQAPRECQFRAAAAPPNTPARRTSRSRRGPPRRLENVLIISACTRVLAAEPILQSVQRADIQDRLALVEIEQRLSNGLSNPLGSPRCPNDQVGEVHGALLVRGVDHRAVVVVEGADLFVGDDTDDLPGNIGTSLGLSRDDSWIKEVLTDRGLRPGNSDWPAARSPRWPGTAPPRLVHRESAPGATSGRALKSSWA